jgi:ElaB/YqjD/DUF883 family membrane-anchored ribosome-binding protein
METTIDERARDAATAVRNAAMAACRQAAALPREALGEDTVENLTDLADRTARRMRRGLHAVDDIGWEAAGCIRRRPFTAVGFTLACGIALGVMVGGFGTKRRLNAVLRDD